VSIQGILDIWYIDSDASRHMTRVHENLIDITHIGDVEVVLRYDQVVKEIGCGTISFQRESLPPMSLREVLYVSGLKKNLVSFSAIEEMGYEVLFHDGKVLLFPMGSSITSEKVIGTRHEKLYKLMFQPVRALIHTTSSSDLCELWHRRMENLHHGDLRVLREIVTGVPYFSTKAPGVVQRVLFGKLQQDFFS
jgi:hypothetical protein